MLHPTHNSLRTAFILLGMLVACGFASGSASAQLVGAGDGVANRAVGRLAEVNANGPGYLYYGLNGADRGLGYIGSYMTLGGFIPLVEDDMGGIWNADLRSHLSVNGGFFSNVGAVRKQFLGGSLLGLGIYWDYDGDLNQYPTWGNPGAIFGQFGHVYQQVGVSGEFLTDWGNLRSNGYIPVGTTGNQLLGNNTPFYQNYIIAQNGIDAALGGADLEVGMYVPGLSDWAGMINVGGYALGNTRYTTNYGPTAGQALVPWFGGVYTRLDLTLANNWDLSLQYNNDSFFDSTGFVRLTYRMGGSRRRNVPDQMEQPMFRNEHIVRSHQTPLVALNPQNGNQPWQVVHVNNTALPGGNGTAESPVRSLTDAQGSSLVANDPWTITYLNQGSSGPLNPYADPFTFQQPNQFLVGSGGPLTIATQPVGGSSLLTIPALSAGNPYLSNPAGSSVVITNGNGGATIANLQIVGSEVGIDASGDLSGIAQPAGTTANPFGSLLSQAGASSVRNVTISGDGTNALQRGVRIAQTATGGAATRPTGSIEFSDTSITNMTSVGFQVGNFDGSGTPISGSGGNADIAYYGTIANNTSTNGNFSSVLVALLETTGGSINLAATATPTGATAPNRILDQGGQGILIQGNTGGTVIDMGNVTLVNTTPTAIAVIDDAARTSIVATPLSGVSAYGIEKTSGDGPAISIDGGSPNFTFFGLINNTATTGTAGGIIGINSVTGAKINISGPGTTPLQDSGPGVVIANADAASDVMIAGLNLTGSGPTAISLTNSDDSTFLFKNTTIAGGMTAQGILLQNNTDSTTQFTDLNMTVSGTAAQGIRADNAGTVFADGTNTLRNASTTAAAIFLDGTTTLGTLAGGQGLNFGSVTSQNASVAPAETAITIGSGPTGQINMGGFTVGATPGTGANVTNPTVGVTVRVGGTQISPPIP